jgi:hypothetical protein
MEEFNHSAEDERYDGPYIITWKNIANLTNRKATACRNVIYTLRKKYQKQHITVDDICNHYTIPKEKYYEAQRKANRLASKL